MAADGEGTGSNAIWAVALVIIVLIIVGAVFYSGVLDRTPAKKAVDVEVTVPSR
jgi:hypothetical protein